MAGFQKVDSYDAAIKASRLTAISGCEERTMAGGRETDWGISQHRAVSITQQCPHDRALCLQKDSLKSR
jgi:hypothetical protein